MDYQSSTFGSVTETSMHTDDISQQNRVSTLVTSPVVMLLRKNTEKAGSRPDWLLYTVPALAFVLGIVLFLFVYKVHKRTGAYYHRDLKEFSSVRQAESDDSGPTYLNKADTPSYENVLAAIYNNQDEVCYYVPEDEDYVIPDDDEGPEEMSPQTHLDCLDLPDTLTGGESYENMEGLYAQPRKTQNRSQEDDDYVDPDTEESPGGLHVPQEQTDTDSYENMEQHFAAHLNGSDDYISPDGDEGDGSRLRHHTQDSGDCGNDSYVSMENMLAKDEDEEWD
ncbi:uncharacterized protein LOC134435323 [Engraulis encrasicolus]|uniref:uncharacterized protein LOC134435323 n=1 Tax=Engraulis encrasicolus TaxID=184585 RepID=UPI002FD5C629